MDKEKKKRERIMKSLSHDVLDSINEILNDRQEQLKDINVLDMSVSLVNAMANVIKQHAHFDNNQTMNIIIHVSQAIKQEMKK